MASRNETQSIKPFEGYTLLMTEIIIVTLNILAVIVIVRFKKIYNPDILIFSLALADLAKTCIPMTMTLAVYFGWRGMQQGTRACDFFGWSAFTTNSGIMMVMTLMSLDRYTAICWPFQYKHSVTRKKLIFAICSVFVYVGVHSTLPLLPVVGVGYMMSYRNGSFCHFELSSEHSQSRGYSIYILTLGVSMLCVVIFCYSRAMCTVKNLMERQRNISSGMRISRDEHRQRATTKMNVMFARMMMVMMFFFCFSWLPFLVVILCNLIKLEIPSHAHFWSMRIAVFNSLLNPIIGATMCKPYRMCYKYILCRIFHCCGLCSTTQFPDPWERVRFYSVTSRRSKSGSVPSVQRESGNYPSGNSGGDSGIDPDTFEHAGPLLRDVKGASRIHHGNPPYSEKKGIDEFKQDSQRVRPKLSTKRISFVDDEPKKNPDAVDEISAEHTEGILKDETRRIGRISLEIIPKTKPSPEFVHPPVERSSKSAISNLYMAPESPVNEARQRNNSEAGVFAPTPPHPSPSNSRSASSDMSAVKEGCHSNSLISAKFSAGGHRESPSPSIWSSSLRRQSAPPVVAVTYFPVFSLNVIQTTALLSSPTQCDSFDMKARPVSPDLMHSDSLRDASHSASECVTLCNDSAISTGQRTDAQLEKDLKQASDHNSTGSSYVQNNKLAVSESNSGVARCEMDHTLVDRENNNRSLDNSDTLKTSPRCTSNTMDIVQFIDSKECEQEVFF